VFVLITENREISIMGLQEYPCYPKFSLSNKNVCHNVIYLRDIRPTDIQTVQECDSEHKDHNHRQVTQILTLLITWIIYVYPSI